MCAECKTILDDQMGSVAGKLYSDVLTHINDATLRPVDYAAPLFYARAFEAFERVGLTLLHGNKLAKVQIDKLIAQTQEACYNADKLIAWSQKTNAEIIEKAAGWTSQLFEWVKEAQEFYTILISEIGWYDHAKDGGS